MIFGLINVHDQMSALCNLPSLDDAQVMVGVPLHQTDYGVVGPGVGIIVYEFGLYEAQQKYFAIGQQLFAGNAVLYRFNNKGETIDLNGLPDVLFMPGRHAVERSIALGLVHRPYLAVDNKVLWRWPEPRPKDFPRTS